MPAYAARLQHYLIGVQILDTEHFDILHLMREIEVNSELSDCVLISKMMLVVEKFSDHFAYENQLMDQIAYPYAQAHKEYHTEFQALVRQYALLAVPPLNRAIVKIRTQFISTRFLEHIDYHDMQLATFVEKTKVS